MSEVAKLLGKVPWWVWAAGAAGVALYVIKKGGVAAATQSAVAGAVSGAGGLVESIGSGLVLGVGDVMGVPRLDETKCQMAKRLGNSLDASKYCGAGDYLSWQWDSLFSSGKVDFIGGGGTFNGHGASGSW